MTRIARGRTPLLLLLLAHALAAAPRTAAAQIVDTTQTPVDSVVITPGADPEVLPVNIEPDRPISTRQAFIRSVLLPGSGQAAFGAYLRGGVYFAGWAGNTFMIFRSQTRLNEARDLYDRRVDRLIDEKAAASAKPLRTRAALAASPVALQDSIRNDTQRGGANELRKLVRAREQQREDWIALYIFWALASGVDGLVTAHLSDFPADIEVRPGQRGQRSMSVGVHVTLPFHRTPRRPEP